jgi:hypothetical protein
MAVTAVDRRLWKRTAALNLGLTVHLTEQTGRQQAVKLSV